MYLDQALFAGGFRPAIDIARSVSRIGGKAQHPRVREEAARIKLDYLQFLELEAFTRFSARLEEGMERKIRRGRVLRELLKQERFATLPAEFNIAWLVAYNEGMLDAVEPGQIPHCLEALRVNLPAGRPGLADDRDTWAQAVAQWLRQSPLTPP